MDSYHEPIRDIAHLGHVELLTPKPDESLRFFKDILGMEEAGRAGQSVYLRGWGQYERYCMKLTESKQPGIGHTALRTYSPQALERRYAAIEKSGYGIGWTDGDIGHAIWGLAFNRPIPAGAGCSTSPKAIWAKLHGIRWRPAFSLHCRYWALIC